MASEKDPGIDFYSGFRKKNHKGGAIRNPKKSRYRPFIVASEKMHKGEGGAILIPKKVGPRNLKSWDPPLWGVPNSILNK